MATASCTNIKSWYTQGAAAWANETSQSTVNSDSNRWYVGGSSTNGRTRLAFTTPNVSNISKLIVAFYPDDTFTPEYTRCFLSKTASSTSDSDYITDIIATSYIWSDSNKSSHATGSYTSTPGKWFYFVFSGNFEANTTYYAYIYMYTAAYGETAANIGSNARAGWVRGRNTSGYLTVTATYTESASDMSVSNGTLGTTQTITVSRASTSFSHTITYTCGTATGTVCTKSTSESISFTPPIDLASQNVSATSVNITFSLQTYSGDTAIGSAVSKTVTMAIPSSVVPSVSLSVSDPTGYLSIFGGYVQNRSNVMATASGSGIYGSSITAYSLTCGSQSSTNANPTFNLPSSGTITITAKVTDSRGRTASASTTISVLAYSSPTAAISDCYRCDSSGNQVTSGGGYAKVVWNASVTSLNAKNSASYKLNYRVRGTTDWTTVDLGSGLSAGSATLFAVSDDYSYEVCIVATDYFTTATSPYRTLSSAGSLVIINKDARTMTFNTAVTFADTVKFSDPTYVEDGWEWVNPPMELGVEYRTKERYNGLPVYTKLLYMGAITNGKNVTVDDAYWIFRHSGNNAGVTSIPYGIPGDGYWWITSFNSGDRFTVYCGEEFEGLAWYEQIWYTKTNPF